MNTPTVSTCPDCGQVIYRLYDGTWIDGFRRAGGRAHDHRPSKTLEETEQPTLEETEQLTRELGQLLFEPGTICMGRGPQRDALKVRFEEWIDSWERDEPCPECGRGGLLHFPGCSVQNDSSDDA